MEKEYITKFGEKCRSELLDSILPFWMEHGQIGRAHV